MKILTTLFVVSTLISLSGCVGPLVRIESIDSQTVSKVKVFPDNTVLQNPKVRVLGVVEATSCRNLAWEPPASIENCTAQMQMRAAKLGANGIILGDADRNVADFISTRNKQKLLEYGRLFVYCNYHRRRIGGNK